MVNSYRQRLQHLYSHDLAPLPGTKPESMRGADLIHRLAEPRHHILVGPKPGPKLELSSQWTPGRKRRLSGVIRRNPGMPLVSPGYMNPQPARSRDLETRRASLTRNRGVISKLA